MKRSWKFLEVFILLRGKSLEFLGTPHLRHLPWLPHSLSYSSVFRHEEEGTGHLSCLGSIVALCAGVGLLQGQHVQLQQDCHNIIIYAVPV